MDSSAAKLRWQDPTTGKALFTVEDMVRFDWRRQVFELKRDKAMDLEANLPPHMGLSREFEARDGEKLLYRGRFISSESSASYSGPTIVFPFADLSPPMYQIQGGYPGAIKDANEPYRTPEVQAALKRAGVLAVIPTNEKPRPIERLSSEWIGPRDGLKVRAEIFPETFRIGEPARVHLFFAQGNSASASSDLEITSTLTADGGKFFCTTEHTIVKPATTVDVLQRGVWVLKWKPWGPVFGAEQTEARPGPAEINFTVTLRDRQGKPVSVLVIPAQKITILPRQSSTQTPTATSNEIDPVEVRWKIMALDLPDETAPQEQQAINWLSARRERIVPQLIAALAVLEPSAARTGRTLTPFLGATIRANPVDKELDVLLGPRPSLQ